MARIRTIKPEIGLHEGLFDLERETGLPIRFSWAVLPCLCDREGRFLWRPRRLGAQILPYDDIDFSRVLDAWVTRGFIVKYRVNDAWFGCVPTFKKHQAINNRESASDIPGIDEADEIIDYRKQEDVDAFRTRERRVNDACSTESQSCQGEGKGKEGKGKEKNARARAPATDQEAKNLNSQAWEKYTGYRRESKLRKLQPTSEKQQQAWLAAQGDQKIQAAIIDQTIRNNWQGLFPLKVNGSGNGARNPTDLKTPEDVAKAFQDEFDKPPPAGKSTDEVRQMILKRRKEQPAWWT